MKTIHKATLPLPLFLAALAAGCSGSDSGSSGGTAAAIVTIASVPSSVGCVEVQVTGGKNADQLSNVTAASGSFPINQLAAGENTFVAYAYPSLCADVQSTAAATFSSASAEATLTAGSVTSVALTLAPGANNGGGGSDGGVTGPTGGSDAGDAGTTGQGDSSTPSHDSGPPPNDGSVTPAGPIDLASATIYSVYVPIFSSDGNLAAVTAQLSRISQLGFNTLYLLPVTEAGKETTPPATSCGGAQGTNGSPYEVKDYNAIDPSIGTSQDLITLVRTAHGLGMHVILDEVLNHTSWDNALITQHPEYFLHCDGNRTNAGSIEIGAGFFADVAQLDYKTTPDMGLRKYIADMLVSVIQTYDVDGFRFDTADDPYGTTRLIPADFWQALRPQLLAAKPGFVMLGEEEDPDLALAPFDLDYNWHLQGYYGDGGLQQVASGGDATLLQQEWTWHQPSNGWPAGMTHMSLLQDWDLKQDFTLYGGVPNTMAAATFNFTIDGVPMLFNGEEVGNDNSGFNTHAPIDWNGANAAKLTPFYASLLALRNGNSTLQKGAVTWVTNSAPSQVVSFTRSDSNGTFLVLINFSSGTQTGTVSGLSASGWTDVSPAGSPGGTSHASPSSFSLAGYDFAVFKAK